MTQSSIRSLAFILLVTLLIGAGSGGYVLCHDDDGRRHIEAAATKNCGPVDGQSSAPVLPEIAAHVDASDDDCGACLDVDLSYDHLQQRLLYSAHLAPPALPMQLVATFTLSPTLNTHLLTSQSRRSPPAYLALRSTVLRC
jgi:hypothetical protein